MSTATIPQSEMTLFTVRQAAEFLTLSSKTVYELLWAGKIPFGRLGNGNGGIRIKKSSLVNYVEKSFEVAVPVQSTKKPAAPKSSVAGLRHIKLPVS